MGIFSAMRASTAAMVAERQRAEVAAANMANLETTRTEAGGPYRRKLVVFESTSGIHFRTQLARAGVEDARAFGTVKVAAVLEDTAPPAMRYEPGHPDANKEGYVAYPNIDPIQEIVDMMGAARVYQMNAAAVNSSKQMILQSLEILR